MSVAMQRILLVGGSNQVSACLIPALADRVSEVLVLSRSDRPAHVPARDNVSWHQRVGDIADAEMSGVDGLVWIAPFDQFEDVLLRCRKLDTVVAFSSASVHGKADSTSMAERALVQSLLDTERHVSECALARSVRSVIFRPTLIYGIGLDRNLSRIASLVSRFGWFVLPRQCAGLRQPVHADDLAIAAISVLLDFRTSKGIYHTGGGERLAYDIMVTRIFHSLGRKPRLLRLPRWCYRLTFRALTLLPRFRDLNLDMVDRMSKDLVVDNDRAGQDFDYRPRGFNPDSASWQKPEFTDNVALTAASE